MAGIMIRDDALAANRSWAAVSARSVWTLSSRVHPLYDLEGTSEQVRKNNS